jgi:cAMP phosphodiesterase
MILRLLLITLLTLPLYSSASFPVNNKKSVEYIDDTVLSQQDNISTANSSDNFWSRLSSFDKKIILLNIFFLVIGFTYPYAIIITILFGFFSLLYFLIKSIIRKSSR